LESAEEKKIVHRAEKQLATPMQDVVGANTSGVKRRCCDRKWPTNDEMAKIQREK